MPWFRRDKRQKAPAAEIAASLFQAFVESDVDGVLPETYRVPPNLIAKFRDRTRLYREAAVLLVLGSRASTERAYEKVLNEYERFIFPPHPTADGIEKLDELKAIMGELDRLLRGDNSGDRIRWALDWFDRIGFEQSNPVLLFQFAHFWMTTYVTLSRVVKEELRPN
jgi:hypothetical protein